MNAPLLPALPGYDNPELIAHGTTALVFRAVQTTLNRLVAIKVITVDTGSVVPVNAARELATTVALSSQPHIVSIIDTGVTDDDRPYIVMEYCEGGSYAAILRHSGPLPLVDVLEVGVKIGEALHAAHQAGIVHRDVKPSNILRSRFGPALTDFGIARAPDELGSTLTRELMTPHHASPEALLHQAQSGISDVYSLASTMWTLLVGHPPFVDPLHPTMDMYAFRDRVLHDDLPSMSRPDVPAWLVVELRRAMSKLPSARHRSALDFAESLRRGALGLGPTEEDPSPSQSLPAAGLIEAANASGALPPGTPPSTFVPAPSAPAAPSSPSASSSSAPSSPWERAESTVDRPAPVVVPSLTDADVGTPVAAGGSLPVIGTMAPPAAGPGPWSTPPPGSSAEATGTGDSGAPGQSTASGAGGSSGPAGVGAGAPGSPVVIGGSPAGTSGPTGPAPRETGGATTGGRSAAPPKPPVIPPLPPSSAGSPAGPAVAAPTPPGTPAAMAGSSTAPATAPPGRPGEPDPAAIPLRAQPGRPGPAGFDPGGPVAGGSDSPGSAWTAPTQVNPTVRPGSGAAGSQSSAAQAFAGTQTPFGAAPPTGAGSTSATYPVSAPGHTGTGYADTGHGDPGPGGGPARPADSGGWTGGAPVAPYPHRLSDGSGTRRLDERAVLAPPPNRRGVLLGVLVAVAVLAVASAAVLILVAKDRSGAVARGSSQTTATAPPSASPQTTKFLTNDPFGAPTNTRLTDHGTEITVTWNDPSPGSAPFVVIGNGPNNEQLPAQNVDRGTTTATFEQLSPTKNYCFRVGAIYSATRVSIADQVCTKR